MVNKKGFYNYVGSLTLPAPVRNLRVSAFNSTAVSLVWDGPARDYPYTPDSDDEEEDKDPSLQVDRYEVYYKLVRNGSRDADDFLRNDIVNTTATDAVVAGLEPGARYQFFAVAHNQAGSSLPSTLVRVKLHGDGDNSGVHNFENLFSRRLHSIILFAVLYFWRRHPTSPSLRPGQGDRLCPDPLDHASLITARPKNSL